MHQATFIEWAKATLENKLAIASDWLVGTRWKDSLTNMAAFDTLKIKSQKLSDAVDEAISDVIETTPDLKVHEIASVLITVSNDLGPNK